MPRFFRVAAIHEIRSGQSKVVPVQGREIVLFNDCGTFYAVKNSCPHRGITLDRVSVHEAIVTCPGHSWQFDLRTGDSLDHAAMGLRCYCVEIREDTVWIEIP